MLTVAALNGAFQGRADRPVNYVNAPLIAAERGVEVREERLRSARDYTNLLRVEVRAGGTSIPVAGTTIGQESRHFLVHALGFALEMEFYNAEHYINLGRVWIAGSTHRGEEAIVLDTFLRVRARCPELTLLLAPRLAR